MNLKQWHSNQTEIGQPKLKYKILIICYCLKYKTLRFSLVIAGMKVPVKICLILVLFSFTLNLVGQRPINSYMEISGKQDYCKIDIGGYSVLPSGRRVNPSGEKIRISRAPYGLTVTPNGDWAVILHSNAVSLVDLREDNMSVQRFPEFDGTGTDIIKGASFIGAHCLQDNRTVMIGGGDRGIIWRFDIAKKKIVDSIDVGAFHAAAPKEAFLTDLVVDEKNGDIWVLDRGWQVLYRIDLDSKKLKAMIPTGRIPFGLALSDDKKSLLFCNVGIYQYPLLPGVTLQNKDSLFLHFPPYGAHSAESDTGIWIGERKIPGLGSAVNEESMSVWIVNTANNTVEGKLQTGLKIGEMLEGSEIVGGSHPSSIVCYKGFAYISQTQNDNIAVIDIQKRRISGYIPIKTNTIMDGYRGYFPYGVDIDRKKQRLYVALLGFNAVAVVNVKNRKTLGFIPTGWGATRVKYMATRDQLLITSARGLGAGPNGGYNFTAPPQGTYIGDIQLGLLQRLSAPNNIMLSEGTRQCIQNTFIQQPNLGELPPIAHIVYITKENRTFDEVFGQLPNVKGDSSLARFGVNCRNILIQQLLKLDSGILTRDRISSAFTRRQWAMMGIDSAYIDSLFKGEEISVTPNHHKIAKSFTLSDNFYCDSDASIHGHHWMMGTIPNEYVETNSANAGNYNIFSPAKGRIFPRTTGAQDPEDYNETGGLWEALKRNNISVFNFGQANEYTNVQEEWYDTSNGTALAVPFPMPEAIFNYTSRKYAGYNMNIPDQFRVEQFEEEFTEKWLSGKDTMPRMLTIQLPNDHTTSPRSEDGYPFIHSYVADNDLALGRMVHFLSRTPYWKNMLVIVTEDDPQGGVDHIDAHRSLLFMAGPYVKRNYVSKVHSNFGSIIKTIYALLDIKPVNQYDLTSTMLLDFFTDKPDYSPYTLEKSDLKIFNPENCLRKYNRSIPWREVQMGEPMDSENYIKKQK